MPDIAVYDSQRAGEQLLFTLLNLEADLTTSVINALTGWDDFYDVITALSAGKDSDKREQIRRHALNLKTHVKPAAIAKSGVAQVETATVGGAASASANVIVTVTAAGMTGSPLAINVAVINLDSAATVAGKIRDALRAQTDITALFYVGGSGATVSLTRLTKADNDATLNIAIDGTTNSTGVPDAASSANTTAGAAQGETAADAVVVAWSTRADAIAFAQGLAGHSSLPDQYRPSSFTQ